MDFWLLGAIVAACILLALFVSTRTLWKLCGVLAVAIVLLSLWNHALAAVLLDGNTPQRNVPMLWQVTARGVEWQSDRVFANGMEK